MLRISESAGDYLIQFTAGIYIRLSKEDEGTGESQSITNQRSLLKAFAAENNIQIFNEYIDEGYSGTNFERPGFKKMIQDLEKGSINTVLTKDMSRLGRDYIDTGYYLEKYFPENKIRYVSVLDQIDTFKENGINDITPFKAILNDMYAKDISRKIKSVKEDKQIKGLFIGAKAPYGYKKDENNKNKLIIDDTAAVIVRKIFQMAYEGKSCREIAYILNQSNIEPPSVYAGLNTGSDKSPFSGKWHSERVSYMLQNQVYIGHMVQGRVKKVSYKSKKSIQVPESRWKVVKNTHESIIGIDLFNAVQNMIKLRRTTRVHTYNIAIKSIVYCKDCGYKMGIIKRALAGGDAFYFICRTYQRFTKMKMCTSHNIQVKYIENATMPHISRLINDTLEKQYFITIIQNHFQNSIQYLWNETNDCNKKLEHAVQAVTRRMDMAYSDRLLGVIEEEDFRRIYKDLQKQRTKLILKKDTNHAKKMPNMEVSTLINEFLETLHQNVFFICNIYNKIEITEDKNIYVHYAFKKP